MALSEFTINLNYNKAMQKASEVRASGNELNSAIESLDSAMTRVNAGWDGENSELYLSKCNKEKMKLVDTRNDIFLTASTIERIAEEVKAADMRALEIARKQEAARRAAEEAARRASESAEAEKARNALASRNTQTAKNTSRSSGYSKNSR
ncbi:MAG: hypothetical protein IKL53_11285 [Lachnospiraceae bacterium]|nr:hypothetical protein [Lachnospiraceae bacterium]